MLTVNKRFKRKLKHTHHDTVFIPFFLQGLKLNAFKNLTRKKHYSYVFIYLIYLVNRLLGIDLKSLKTSCDHLAMAYFYGAKKTIWTDCMFWVIK